MATGYLIIVGIFIGLLFLCTEVGQALFKIALIVAFYGGIIAVGLWMFSTFLK